MDETAEVLVEQTPLATSSQPQEPTVGMEPAAIAAQAEQDQPRSGDVASPLLDVVKTAPVVTAVNINTDIVKQNQERPLQASTSIDDGQGSASTHDHMQNIHQSQSSDEKSQSPHEDEQSPPSSEVEEDERGEENPEDEDEDDEDEEDGDENGSDEEEADEPKPIVISENPEDGEGDVAASSGGGSAGESSASSSPKEDNEGTLHVSSTSVVNQGEERALPLDTSLLHRINSATSSARNLLPSPVAGTRANGLDTKMESLTDPRIGSEYQADIPEYLGADAPRPKPGYEVVPWDDEKDEPACTTLVASGPTPPREWQPTERAAFEKAVYKNSTDFHLVARDVSKSIKEKVSVRQCVQFFYDQWHKTRAYQIWKKHETSEWDKAIQKQEVKLNIGDRKKVTTRSAAAAAARSTSPNGSSLANGSRKRRRGNGRRKDAGSDEEDDDGRSNSGSRANADGTSPVPSGKGGDGVELQPWDDPSNEYVPSRPHEIRTWSEETREKEEWCICRGTSEGCMVECTSCKKWFHAVCMGIRKDMLDEDSIFRCLKCATVGPKAGMVGPELLKPVVNWKISPKRGEARRICIIPQEKFKGIRATGEINDSDRPSDFHRTTKETGEPQKLKVDQPVCLKVVPADTRDYALLLSTRRVPVWDHENKRLIAGIRAPSVAELEQFLTANKDMRPYHGSIKPNPRSNLVGGEMTGKRGGEESDAVNGTLDKSSSRTAGSASPLASKKAKLKSNVAAVSVKETRVKDKRARSPSPNSQMRSFAMQQQYQMQQQQQQEAAMQRQQMEYLRQQQQQFAGMPPQMLQLLQQQQMMQMQQQAQQQQAAQGQNKPSFAMAYQSFQEQTKQADEYLAGLHQHHLQVMTQKRQEAAAELSAIASKYEMLAQKGQDSVEVQNAYRAYMDCQHAQFAALHLLEQRHAQLEQTALSQLSGHLLVSQQTLLANYPEAVPFFMMLQQQAQQQPQLFQGASGVQVSGRDAQQMLLQQQQQQQQQQMLMMQQIQQQQQGAAAAQQQQPQTQKASQPAQVQPTQTAAQSTPQSAISQVPVQRTTSNSSNVPAAAESSATATPAVTSVSPMAETKAAESAPADSERASTGSAEVIANEQQPVPQTVATSATSAATSPTGSSNESSAAAPVQRQGEATAPSTMMPPVTSKIESETRSVDSASQTEEKVSEAAHETSPLKAGEDSTEKIVKVEEPQPIVTAKPATVASVPAVQPTAAPPQAISAAAAPADSSPADLARQQMAIFQQQQLQQQQQQAAHAQQQAAHAQQQQAAQAQQQAAHAQQQQAAQAQQQQMLQQQQAQQQAQQQVQQHMMQAQHAQQAQQQQLLQAQQMVQQQMMQAQQRQQNATAAQSQQQQQQMLQQQAQQIQQQQMHLLQSQQNGNTVAFQPEIAQQLHAQYVQALENLLFQQRMLEQTFEHHSKTLQDPARLKEIEMEYQDQTYQLSLHAMHLHNHYWGMLGHSPEQVVQMLSMQQGGAGMIPGQLGAQAAMGMAQAGVQRMQQHQQLPQSMQAMPQGMQAIPQGMAIQQGAMLGMPGMMTGVPQGLAGLTAAFPGAGMMMQQPNPSE